MYHVVIPFPVNRNIYALAWNNERMIQVYLDLHIIGTNKKVPVFRVTRLYLNLLVKPRIFFPDLFGKKNIILCILKSCSSFKMHKIMCVFFQKKNKENVCLVPTLPKIFRPVTQDTHNFIYGLVIL